MKEESLYNNLIHLNYNNLVASLSRWDSLLIRERFFAVISSVKILPTNRCLEIVLKYEKDLKEIGVYHTLRSLIACDLEENLSEIFFKSITTESNHPDPLIRAELHAIAGYIFLSAQQFGLAKEYYSHAASLYGKEKISSLRWKYQNNVFICQTYINKSYEPRFLNKILKDFNELSFSAKSALIKILCLELCYLNKKKIALNLIENISNQYSNPTPSPDKNFSQLLIYLYYIAHYLMDKPNKILPYNSLITSIEPIQFIKKIEEKNNSQIWHQLQKWDQELEYDYKYMLTDMVFSQLLAFKKHEELFQIFKKFEKLILPKWGVIIPPRSLYYNVCLALRALKRKRLLKIYLEKHRKTAAIGETAQLAKVLRKKEKNLLQLEVSLNVETKQIKHKSTLVSLSNSPKSYLLVETLCEADRNKKKYLSFHFIFKILYKDECYDEKKNEKLIILLRRLKYSLKNSEIYYIENDGIVLNSKYCWEITQQHKKKIINRKKAILSLLSASTDGLRAIHISDQLKLSRRTIINDLNELILEAKIKKIGMSKNTIYTKI